MPNLSGPEDQNPSVNELISNVDDSSLSNIDLSQTQAQPPPEAPAPAQAAPAEPPTPEQGSPPARQGDQPPTPKVEEAGSGPGPEQGSQPIASAPAPTIDIASLQAQIQELRSQLQSAKAPEAPSQPAEPPVEVKELDQAIFGLAQNYASLDASRKEAEAQRKAWTQRQVELIRAMQSASEEDVLRLRVELNSALWNVQGWEVEEKRLEGATTRVVQDYNIYNSMKAQVQKLVNLHQAKESSDQEREEELAQSWKKEWNTAAQAIATAKIPERHRKRFTEQAWKNTGYEVNVADREITDLAGFLAKEADTFIALLREEASQYAQAKASDAKVSAPANGKAANAPPAPSRQTLDSSEALEAHISQAWGAERI